jgi:hypothetical protein
MATPAAKREAVAHLRTLFEVSERRACKVLGADRTSARYRGQRADDAIVRAHLRELAALRRQFVYRRLLVLMRREAGSGQLVEVPPYMPPAGGKSLVALLGQHLVAAIAIDLKDALEAIGRSPSRWAHRLQRPADRAAPKADRLWHRRGAGRSWSVRARIRRLVGEQLRARLWSRSHYRVGRR